MSHHSFVHVCFRRAAKKNLFVLFLELESQSPGLPDFTWYIRPKWGKIYQTDHKIYQKAVKYTKRPLNTPNGLKIPNGHTKNTKIGIFGLKTHNLATLQVTHTWCILQTRDGHAIVECEIESRILKFFKLCVFRVGNELMKTFYKRWPISIESAQFCQ
jgi:hypothetical protein